MVDNKYKILIMSGVVAFLSGCAALPEPEDIYRDNQPLVTGKPVSQRVAESQNKVNNQFALLERIASGGQVGTYGVVQHNNELDARKGSNYTLPQDYAHDTYDIPSPDPVKFKAVRGEGAMLNQSGNYTERAESSSLVPRNYTDTVTSEVIVSKIQIDGEIDEVKINSNKFTHSVFSRKVKHIDWKNRSLNELSKNLSQVIDYSLVVKPGQIKDKKVNYSAKDKEVGVIIQEIESKYKDYLDIIVIDENKTFNLFYK